METEEIKFVQARYHYLGLTFEQAARILTYETIWGQPFSNHILSAWEDMDFELSFLRDVLDDRQMTSYQQHRESILALHIENLIEQDNQNAKWLDYQRAKIDYLKTNLLPSFFQQPFSVFPFAFGEDRDKIDYLKACYKNFLHKRRKEELVNHIRLNKTFAPNGWKQILLTHYVSCVIPDYWAFECAMDVPTRSVAQFLKERLYRQNPETEAFQLEMLRELKEFDRQNYEKFYQPIAGWSVWTRQPFTEADEKVHWAMSLLLISRNAFGFENPAR